jgi:hypothetical protein
VNTAPKHTPAQDAAPVAAEACTEVGAEQGHPRVPRKRPLLTPAGRAWLGYFAALAAVAATVFLIRR